MYDLIIMISGITIILVIITLVIFLSIVIFPVIMFHMNISDHDIFACYSHVLYFCSWYYHDYYHQHHR